MPIQSLSEYYIRSNFDFGMCVCVCVCSDGTNRTEFLVRFSLLLLLVAGSEVNSLV